MLRVRAAVSEGEGWSTEGHLKKVMGMQPFRMALKSRVVSCVAPGAHTQKRDLAMSASVSCIGNTQSSYWQQQSSLGHRMPHLSASVSAKSGKGCSRPQFSSPYTLPPAHPHKCVSHANEQGNFAPWLPGM